MTKTDIEYVNYGLFTQFFPITEEGQKIWNQIADQTEGTGKVFSVHANQVIAQIKKAGYACKKQKRTKQEIATNDLLAELGI